MKTNQVIAWVTKKVKNTLTGRTDVIEIDSAVQITNQLAARRQKILTVASQNTSHVLTRPAEPIDVDLDKGIHEIQIDQAINQRIQKLMSPVQK